MSYEDKTRDEKNRHRGNRGGSWNGVDRSAQGPRSPRPKAQSRARSKPCVYCAHKRWCRCPCCGQLREMLREAAA